MHFEVSSERKRPGVYIVKPVGNLDSNNYPLFEEKVMPILVPSTKALIFDMSGLEYISSAGVRVVIRTKKAMTEFGRYFMITDLKPKIRNIFDILNALPDMHIFNTLEAAGQFLDSQ